MPYTIDVHGVTDIGLQRSNNEDVFAILEEEQFYALADGMGGHLAGEVAAREAVEFLCKKVPSFNGLSSKEYSHFLHQAIIDTNTHVFRLAQKKKEHSGMGTTLCCFQILLDNLIYAHVGDSRIYRFRKKLERLTEDHSLRYELIAKGLLDEEKAATFPLKNVITRAIGTSSFVEPDVGVSELMAHDIYFMCSDGLTDVVSDREIGSIIEKQNSVEEICNELVSKALAKGGNDNITIVMIKILP